MTTRKSTRTTKNDDAVKDDAVQSEQAAKVAEKPVEPKSVAAPAAADQPSVPEAPVGVDGPREGSATELAAEIGPSQITDHPAPLVDGAPKAGPGALDVPADPKDTPEHFEGYVPDQHAGGEKGYPPVTPVNESQPPTPVGPITAPLDAPSPYNGAVTENPAQRDPRGDIGSLGLELVSNSREGSYLIDMATKEAPDPDTLFKREFEHGQQMICTVRLCENLYMPNTEPISRLVFPAGQRVDQATAEKFVALVKAQRGDTLEAADSAESEDSAKSDQD